MSDCRGSGAAARSASGAPRRHNIWAAPRNGASRAHSSQRNPFPFLVVVCVYVCGCVCGFVWVFFLFGVFAARPCEYLMSLRKNVEDFGRDVPRSMLRGLYASVLTVSLLHDAVAFAPAVQRCSTHRHLILPAAVTPVMLATEADDDAVSAPAPKAKVVKASSKAKRASKAAKNTKAKTSSDAKSPPAAADITEELAAALAAKAEAEAKVAALEAAAAAAAEGIAEAVAQAKAEARAEVEAETIELVAKAKAEEEERVAQAVAEAVAAAREEAMAAAEAEVAFQVSAMREEMARAQPQVAKTTTEIVQQVAESRPAEAPHDAVINSGWATGTTVSDQEAALAAAEAAAAREVARAAARVAARVGTPADPAEAIPAPLVDPAPQVSVSSSLNAARERARKASEKGMYDSKEALWSASAARAQAAATAEAEAADAAAEANAKAARAARARSQADSSWATSVSGTANTPRAVGMM